MSCSGEVLPDGAEALAGCCCTCCGSKYPTHQSRGRVLGSSKSLLGQMSVHLERMRGARDEMMGAGGTNFVLGCEWTVEMGLDKEGIK